MAPSEPLLYTLPLCLHVCPVFWLPLAMPTATNFPLEKKKSNNLEMNSL